MLFLYIYVAIGALMTIKDFSDKNFRESFMKEFNRLTRQQGVSPTTRAAITGAVLGLMLVSLLWPKYLIKYLLRK